MALFPQPQIPQNNLLSQMQAIRQMMGGNPQAFAMQMRQSNPQFAAFVRDNQGKSPEQIAQEHGIDYSAIRQFMM